MNPLDTDPLYGAINAKLTAIVEASPTTPAWHEAWIALGPKSTEEERLKVYQAVRDSGCLPAEAGFYLVSWQIDAMTNLKAETSLGHLDEQMTAMERAHGLDEGEFWNPGEAPVEYESLRLQYQDAWDDIFAAKLEECGEHEMARQFRTDPDGFQKRSEAGGEFFHGPQAPDESDVPAWLYALAEAVAACMTADSPMGPLGYRYREEDGFWELIIYPTPVELVGGATDGEIVDPGFSLDLEGLRSVFDRLEACSWQSLGFSDDEGPQVSIEGVYEGREVYVQILAYAPEDEEPGMKFHTMPRKP